MFWLVPSAFAVFLIFTNTSLITPQTLHPRLFLPLVVLKLFQPLSSSHLSHQPTSSLSIFFPQPPFLFNHQLPPLFSSLQPSFFIPLFHSAFSIASSYTLHAQVLVRTSGWLSTSDFKID